MNLHDRTILLIAPEIINPRSMPCVGLGYVGAYLASRNLQVRIVDAQHTKEDPIPLLREIPPTLVAIGVDSRTIERGLRLARIAKAHGHVTMLGGLHVSLIKTDILRHDEVDYGIVGDGEAATAQLVEALEGTRAFTDVSGLVYRSSEGHVVANANTTETADLDSLPFPDYRLAGIHEIGMYPLVTSRDCPYKCTFCTVGNISHGRFRQRSPASCVDEILAARQRYGIKSFLVVDENFSVRMDRAYAFCRELIERRVNLPWTAFEGVRADCLTADFIELLKASGCKWVFFGVESAESAVLDKVRKGSKLSHIQRAVDLARSHGLNVGGFLILGLPDSTFERDMRSVDWAVNNLDRCQFWMSIPYYGTKLYEWVKANARLLRQPIGDTLVNSLSTMPFYDTPEYPAGQIKRAHTIASLRTGVSFFYEYLDQESFGRLKWSERQKRAPARKLVNLVCRWDPSWLGRIASGRHFPPVKDPLQLAREEAHRGAAREVLTNDFQEPVGKPVRVSTGASQVAFLDRPLDKHRDGVRAGRSLR